jgi:F420-dependent oxidoreductase-like protein
MRLGLNLSYLVGADDVAGQLRLTRYAEELGFGVVWAAEAYGSDSPTVLAWIAAQTKRIGIGSAVMQIPARTPAMTGMTAATLDLLSEGRFHLGLGVSGPQVSEGWHGVSFAQPLARTREYVAIVRAVLARQTVVSTGKHYPLPLPDGPGKPLKLTIAPHRSELPIYLAAVGPKNLQLAGEIADGWLAVFFAPDFATEQLADLNTGRARGARQAAGFDVVASVPLSVGVEPRLCADPIRAHAALYVGGMGSRQANFYNALTVRMGFEEAAVTVQDLYLARRHRDAMAAVPYEFIDATSLLGPRARLTEKLTLLAAAGVTTCAVAPVGKSVEEKLHALRVVTEAYEDAGVAG